MDYQHILYEVERGRSIDDDIWMLERSNVRIRALWEIHKPVIAQVHGHCLAGGTDVALCCDMVIVADDAVIGFPLACVQPSASAMPASATAAPG